MARISGCVSFRSRVSPEKAAKPMLSCLPGKHSEVSVGADFFVGWKGNSTVSSLRTFNDFTVAIDGRILNGKELAEKASDHIDDLDLIAGLYRKFGFEAMLDKLEGDYVIVIFDSRSESLFIGRDRLGVKPLYYAAVDNSALVFASQPRALLAIQELDTGINIGFAARSIGMHYRTFDNHPEESPYRGIKQLPAAHMLVFQKDSAPKVRCYWELEELDEWAHSKEELAEQYRDLLLSAVKKRVTVAEKPAFTLSGGLDSSSVLCCASEVQGRKQIAFSSVYADPTYDERNEIKDVVDERVESWKPFELGDEVDIFNIVREMVHVHDEPVATATWLSHYLLTKDIASQGFTSLFGGLGGDELNAGEYEYFPMYFADLRVAGKEEQFDAEVSAWAQFHDHPIHKKDRHIAERMMSEMADINSPGKCLPNLERMLRYSSVVNKSAYDLSGFYPTMDVPFKSFLKNRTYQDMVRETLPCCLRAEDRQCTAVGLEHFDPFLDHKLVEFMFRVPGDLKIKNGVTKQLLRSAMRGILPEATRTRIAKTGWNAPAHKWFDGKTLSTLRDIVSSQRFKEHGLINSEKVIWFINDHERIMKNNLQEENHMMFLWQLLNMIVWLELN